MELCLLNLFILIDCFCLIPTLCVLLSHLINQESYVYSWNSGKIYLVHSEILKSFKISKFQKSEPGKLLSNFHFKHVITSTNSSNHLWDTSDFRVPWFKDHFWPCLPNNFKATASLPKLVSRLISACKKIRSFYQVILEILEFHDLKGHAPFWPQHPKVIKASFSFPDIISTHQNSVYSINSFLSCSQF